MLPRLNVCIEISFGPNGAGTAVGFKPPLNILPQHAAWKTSPSPVPWRDRVYVTGVESNRLVTVALDAKSGQIVWKRLAPEVPLERVHIVNSAAASTPCVDEGGVYVYSGFPLHLFRSPNRW